MKEQGKVLICGVGLACQERRRKKPGLRRLFLMNDADNGGQEGAGIFVKKRSLVFFKSIITFCLGIWEF